MSDTMRAAIIFLVNAVFDLYLFILVVRLILAWVSAEYNNPLTQFVVQCTNFIIKPLRQYLPNFRDLETSTLVLIIVLELIKFLIVLLLSFGFPNVLGLLLLAIVDAFKLILETFFYAIILHVILSWLQPGTIIDRVLVKFTSPILKPLQRFIPPIRGFDITPFVALVILQLLIIIAVNPLIYLSLGIAVKHV